VALANVAVKLVPTTYKKTFHAAKETYQASMSRHIMQPETLATQHSNMPKRGRDDVKHDSTINQQSAKHNQKDASTTTYYFA
jgi:hypothetical protein